MSEVEITIANNFAKVLEYGSLTDPAKPYIRPAIETVRPRATQLYKQGGIRAIAEAVVTEMKLNLARHGQQKLGEEIKITEIENGIRLDS